MHAFNYLNSVGLVKKFSRESDNEDLNSRMNFRFKSSFLLLIEMSERQLRLALKKQIDSFLLGVVHELRHVML